MFIHLRKQWGILLICSNYFLRLFLWIVASAILVGICYRDALRPARGINVPAHRFVDNITLPDLLVLMQIPETLLIDTRNNEYYNVAHIPGAINLPVPINADDINEDVMLQLRSAGNIIVIDADGSHLFSGDLEKTFGHIGIIQIKLYNGGWKQWKACSLPITRVVDDN